MKEDLEEDTKIVNIKYEKFDVYIGRGKGGTVPNPPHSGCFGNPFTVAESGRGHALALYKEYFNNRIINDDEFRQAVLKLRGKRLGCFCKPAPCHGDVIKEWLDQQPGCSSAG